MPQGKHNTVHKYEGQKKKRSIIVYNVCFFLRRRFILYRKKQIDKKNTYILCKIYIHIQSILNT